jgi:hypothetical protein
MKILSQKNSQAGFSLVEVVLACVIFPIIVVGMTNSFTALRHTYTISKQLNEIYAVLSACPEIDRALEYDSISGTDPLQAVPDSKVIDISVNYQQNTGKPLELRMLITRNGVGQL